MDAAKEAARAIYQAPTLEETLEQWFEGKYKIPSNHELFRSRTYHDLLVEFFVDFYRENPLEAFKTGEDGRIVFTNTGDPLIDEWEKRIAAGETPDLTDAFSPSDLEKVRTASKRSQERKKAYGSSFKDVHDTMNREAKRSGLTSTSDLSEEQLNKIFRTFGNLDE